MNTNRDPKEIAETILRRSICEVKVGACLIDSWGVHAWGWNSSGPTGYGECAEGHCFKRSSWRRLAGSTLYVAAIRTRNDKVITAKPCENCQKLIRATRIKETWYRDRLGIWRML